MWRRSEEEEQEEQEQEEKKKKKKEEEEKAEKGKMPRKTGETARSAGRTTTTTTTTLALAKGGGKGGGGGGNNDDDDEVDPEASEVVYIGHLPHGFYEKELRGFFSQFGDVKNVKVSRSKKSARSKGYAFVGFESAAVAAIACNALNGYVMFGQVLKCNIMRRADIHADLFKGCDKKFRTIPWQTIAVEKHDKPLTEAEAVRRQSRLLRGEKIRRKKIADAGIEYEFDGYAEAEQREIKKESTTDVEEDEKTQKKKNKKKKTATPTTTKKQKRSNDDDDVPGGEKVTKRTKRRRKEERRNVVDELKWNTCGCDQGLLPHAD